MSAIHEAETWFVAIGSDDGEEGRTANIRHAALQIGLQMEELGKKVSVLSSPMGVWMRQYALMFIGGECDQLVREAMADRDRAALLLQGDMQVIWQTVGAARALGAPVGDVFAAEVETKWKLEQPDGTFHLDQQSGIVQPPEGWTKPDYASYLP